jgi:hypothetical protein
MLKLPIHNNTSKSAINFFENIVFCFYYCQQYYNRNFNKILFQSFWFRAIFRFRSQKTISFTILNNMTLVLHIVVVFLLSMVLPAMSACAGLAPSICEVTLCDDNDNGPGDRCRDVRYFC